MKTSVAETLLVDIIRKYEKNTHIHSTLDIDTLGHLSITSHIHTQPRAN